MIEPAGAIVSHASFVDQRLDGIFKSADFDLIRIDMAMGLRPDFRCTVCFGEVVEQYIYHNKHRR
jgi:hypothetical protein